MQPYNAMQNCFVQPRWHFIKFMSHNAPPLPHFDTCMQPSMHLSLAMCSSALANRLQLKALSQVCRLLNHTGGSGCRALWRLAPAHPSEQKVCDSISSWNLLGHGVRCVLKPFGNETASHKGWKWFVGVMKCVWETAYFKYWPAVK